MFLSAPAAGAALFLRASLFATLALAIGGCVDTVGQARGLSDLSGHSDLPGNIARREGVSPRGANVAFAPVEGASPTFAEPFSLALTRAAVAQDVSVSDARKAHYIARFYLTAIPGEGGVTRISCVADLFDQNKRRVQRMGDDIVVRSTSADPWSGADPMAAQALADKSAAALAAALTNTSEALAAMAGKSHEKTSIAIPPAAPLDRPPPSATRLAQSGATALKPAEANSGALDQAIID